MARRKTSAPRRGSLGLRPRKRASSIVPRIKTWPKVNLENPILLGFLTYKAGMTHVFVVDDRPGRPTTGKEIFMPVTVLEAPPMVPLAIRAYIRDLNKGLLTLTEAWVEPPKELEIWRAIPTFNAKDFDKKLKIIEENLKDIEVLSTIVASQPKLTCGLSKKKPDIVEIKVGGGTIESQLKYLTKILGKEVKVSDVFKEGQFVDVIGVTKGKGFQGVIKRFGVKELPRWHKHRKGSRRIGSRSPGIGTLSTVPQPGQMGFHRRTEYNKRILKIGNNGYEVVPAGGFPHYGIIKSDYIILQGSIFGPPKRPIFLRWPIRPPRWVPEGPPIITYISLESKM
ncbi:MAG TPA: 50S ribosomal protein L3 [Acidilobales archaeon]|nr:50S ribosomal protein L3 [Acidilobales archaeon]